ncbi:MAG: stage III sporulation protein AA [Lachnospiraceae bacterium]|nr:stage III sporulation protein AA [Lachnospiraceae bacterium]
MRAEEILSLFPEESRDRWREVAKQAKRLQEIRIRAGMPLSILLDNREYFLDMQGRVVDGPEEAARPAPEELEDMLGHLCRYSIYAFADEIRQGFLTVRGGHRVGLAGQVILDGEGRIKNMKYIRYLNIRIAHQIRGAADALMPCLYEEGRLVSTLLVSPPGGGKTTMLRDIIRQASEGTVYGPGVNVSVVDERSEIAGSYLGVSQNDVGIRTDVLDGCPKVEGMMRLIRSMAPQVLAVDEVGSLADAQALQMAGGCGCRLLATIHGGSFEEVRQKKYMRYVMEQGLFERYVILDRRQGACRIVEIYDREGKPCTRR